MRLYKQELKRLFHTKRIIVIFIFAVVMSALLAILPSEFSDANYLDEEGNTIQLHGIEAIKFIEEKSYAGNGKVTAEQLKEALQKYQDLYREYGKDPLKGNLPLDIYWEEVAPIRPLLRMITTAYGTNEREADLVSLKPSDMESFYKVCETRLEDAMKSDDILDDPEYIGKAQAIYRKVEQPFVVSHGYTRDALDYVSITILLLVLLSVVMTAPVFAERYESGEDSVIRCTVFGKGKLVRTTILATLTVSSLMYLVGIGLHLFISDMIFGIDTLKESVQVLYTVYSLPPLNLLGLQIVLALTGWICCIATVVMATSISAIMRETSTAMVISIVIVFLPTFIYMGIGSVNWLLAILPSASVGLSNNMLYSLVDLRFLRMGGTILWYPVVLVISDIIETAAFGIIAHFAYIRHQVR